MSDMRKRRGSGAVSVSSGSAHLSSRGEPGGSDGHDRFGTAELAIVLSHYELGVIESVRAFPRGSRRSPKLVIRCDRGNYLLKRRASGKDDPFKIAFSHQLQLVLIAKQYPLPHLVGTRRENNSMVQWNGAAYELFEYVKGTAYSRTLKATASAGQALGHFHRLLRDYKPDYEPSVGSYHAAPTIASSLDTIPRKLAKVDPDSIRDSSQLDQLIRYLQTNFEEAAVRVNDGGLPDWPVQIIHCDWHPGNILYRGYEVVAVVDFDAARFDARIVDVANGALQFSILAGGGDPTIWPEAVDLEHFQSFVRAYESVPEVILSKMEVKIIPWLMIEAIIAESAIPIANTGRFARIQGVGFLRMVERKVRWIRENAKKLIKILED